MQGMLGLFLSICIFIIVVVHFSVKMSQYSVSEHISIVKAYYSSNNSSIVSQRKFATEYKLKTTGPSVITIKNLIQKFERTGNVCDDSVGNVGCRVRFRKDVVHAGRSMTHWTNRVFEVLEEHFGERILALGYPEATGMGIAWLPYSPDLNTCDSFLWGNIKDKVYANKPKTIAKIKTAIQEVIESIDVLTLQRVVQNFAICLCHIIASDGKHIEHVIT